MKYDIEIFCFDGEASQKLATCDGAKTAVLIAQALDRGGEFKGEEFLSGQNVKWRLRIVEYDDNGHADVYWEGQP